MSGRYWKTERINFGDSSCRIPFNIDAQVNTRIEGAGGYQRHDCDKRFQAHRAITNRPRIRLASNDLGGRAAGNQCVKTGNRAAGDGDEAEWENFSSHNQPTAIDKTADRRHMQIW